ncbi:unnamed protein product [Allacma fusca]|uniref:Uncharacterized protein n=1 Tax=Allacma fusca TaxID=39272 RepID=A0A8J2L5J9_9HEXA|nr:unnamed protein product [Allacma fusca]
MDSKENKKTCPFHETIQVSDVESYCFEKFAVTQSSCKMLEITVKDSDVVCDEDIGITYIGTHLLNDGTIKYCNIGNDGSYLKIIPSGGCRDYLT